MMAPSTRNFHVTWATSLRLSLCLLLSAAATLSPSSAAKVASLWVLGDDYLDLGTGAYVDNLGRKCAVSPYGQNLQAATGRCSNGKILTDQISQQLGLEIGPFSGPAAFQTNGAAFAAAGAGALRQTNSKTTVTMAQQLQQFEGVVTKTGVALNDSLVIVSFGMNDYLQAILVGKDPMAYVDRVIPNIINAIKKVKKISGAYRFVVLGVPPLGCLPLVLRKYFMGPGSCLTNLNEVNKKHEERIIYALDKLVTDMPNDAPIFYSFFSLTYAFESKTMGYTAFKKPWDVACGQVGKDGTLYGCGQSMTTTDEKGQETTAPVEAVKMSGYDYFWWDWLNPTENAFYMMWITMWMGGDDKAIYPTSVMKLTFK